MSSQTELSSVLIEKVPKNISINKENLVTGLLRKYESFSSSYVDNVLMRLFLGDNFQYQLVMEKKNNSTIIGENNENIEEYVFYTRGSKKTLEHIPCIPSEEKYCIGTGLCKRKKSRRKNNLQNIYEFGSYKVSLNFTDCNVDLRSESTRSLRVNIEVNWSQKKETELFLVLLHLIKMSQVSLFTFVD